ncbi:MAG: hypothetical protein ACRCXZ_08160 [Patescibacteria group bacterium]
MKFLVVVVLFLFCFCFFPSNAHLVPNSITRTTAFEHDESKNLKVNYSIFMPSTELDQVISKIDIDKNKEFSQKEEEEFLIKMKDLFYFRVLNQEYKPMSLTVLSKYDDLSKELFPILEMKFNFGEVTLPKNFEGINIVNKLTFNTLYKQDWNISTDKNINIEFKDVAFSPDPTIPSENINGQIKSIFGELNTSIFAKINNNSFFQQIRAFLKSPNYSIQSLAWILGICAMLGLFHAFQPGHGKAIIGTYLASINGNFKDSMIMALSTTISHTSVIILLSLFWALLKDGVSFIIPFINIPISIPKELINIPNLATWLRYISSILLVFTGLYMASKSIRAWSDYRINKNLGIYDEVILDVDNSNPFKIIDHGDHKHILPNKRLNLKESIWLGFNTGLTPCLDALILFTLSLGLGLGWVGFWMLVVFSFGLGVALALIGYVSAKAINVSSKQFTKTEEITILLPILSSLVIIILAFINIFN